MKLKTFPGGVHPHDHKEYSKNAPIEKMDLPLKVVIPLSQHIGAPSKPVVKVGEQVKTGQIIAEPGGFVSITQHASITGKVTKIAEFPHPCGTTSMAIEITGDGQTDEWIELTNEEDVMSVSVDVMKDRIKIAGVCGMGGAGFPTHVKLSPPADKSIDTVILNGVECEPYLTADYRLMLERADDIVTGLQLVMKIVGAKRGMIGIEANKPDAIKVMQKAVSQLKDISVVGLKVRYPQGGEKQLIYAATKRSVPNKGGLPMDIGVVVQNVGTAVAVYEAVRYSKACIDRVITISGKIVTNPKNLQARIGTSFQALFDKCGGAKEEIAKVISGGPMMGFAIPDLTAPMAKGSSGLLFLNKKEAKMDIEYTCLHCGRCVDVCPHNLIPSMISNGAMNEDWDMAEKAGAMDCMKCGTCAYVCPAQIKMVQWIDIAKINVGKIIRERQQKS